MLLFHVYWVNSAIIASYITPSDMGTNVDNWEFKENEYNSCDIRKNEKPERCTNVYFFSIYFLYGSNIYTYLQGGIVEAPGGSINSGVLFAPAYGDSDIGNRCQSPIDDVNDNSICWGIGKGADAILSISTLGITNVNIRYTIDPWNAVDNGICVVSYSIDNGTTYNQMETYDSTDEGPANPIFLATDVDNQNIVKFKFSGDLLVTNDAWCYIKGIIINGDTQTPTMMPSNSPTLTPTKTSFGPTLTPTLAPTIPQQLIQIFKQIHQQIHRNC